MNFVPAASAAPADDALLIARYVAGDEQAFTPLLLRYQTRVFTTILLIVRDRALAEDLVQDTFISALRTLRAGRYTENGKFGAWVLRIGHNLAIDATRCQKRTPTISLDARIGGHDTSTLTDRPRHDYLLTANARREAADQTPEAVIIRHEQNEQLRSLIQELPNTQRQVLLMRHYGEMSFQEIADATGVPVNTTLSRMRRALLKLRQRLASGGTAAALLMAVLTCGNPSALLPDFSPSISTDADDSTRYATGADPLCVR